MKSPSLIRTYACLNCGVGFGAVGIVRLIGQLRARRSAKCEPGAAPNGPVKTLMSFLIVAIACALSTGCSTHDPDLARATQEFQKQYPEYLIRSSRVVRSEEDRKVVTVEFDAPNNRKNRGRAELLMRKGSNGSCDIVSKKVSMWKH